MSANTFQVQWKLDIDKAIERHQMAEGGAVQQYVDTQILRLSEPLIPKDQDYLIRSGIAYTVIGSGWIRWRTPYARRWYYMPANFQEAPQRGNYWFERMKQQYKDQIIAGAQRILTG